MARSVKESSDVADGKTTASKDVLNKRHYSFLVREMFFRGLWIMYAGVTIQIAVAGMLTRPLKGSYSNTKNQREIEEDGTEDKHEATVSSTLKV